MTSHLSSATESFDGWAVLTCKMEGHFQIQNGKDISTSEIIRMYPPVRWKGHSCSGVVGSGESRRIIVKG